LPCRDGITGSAVPCVMNTGRPTLSIFDRWSRRLGSSHLAGSPGTIFCARSGNDVNGKRRMRAQHGCRTASSVAIAPPSDSPPSSAPPGIPSPSGGVHRTDTSFQQPARNNLHTGYTLRQPRIGRDDHQLAVVLDQAAGLPRRWLRPADRLQLLAPIPSSARISHIDRSRLRASVCRTKRAQSSPR
jgi:hypothetical protein